MNDFQILIIGLVCLYFLPTLIALLRWRSNLLAIFALNLFLGWTLVGWVVSLVWSLKSQYVQIES